MPHLISTPLLRLIFCVTFFLPFFFNAQIGINTDNPDPSSLLDISGTAGGVLIPRMTSLQKNSIPNPSEGLLVYDTDLKYFSFYTKSTNTWSKILNNGSEGSARLRYKIIKETDDVDKILASELTAGGGTKYILNANTYYELNGRVVFNKPIDLNGANISGLNSTDDKLISKVSTGALFSGTKGGTIKLLTIEPDTYGTQTLFDINATAVAATDSGKNLIYRDCITNGFLSQGKLEGFGMVFQSVILNAANKNGIHYVNIGKVFLSNVAWFGNNSGTYEKASGTFGIFQKQGGFSEVPSGAIGLDVSLNPIVGEGIIESVVYSGSGTFVNKYTTVIYPGYNFNNNWNIDATGIPQESDNNATGATYQTNEITTINLDNSTPNVELKITPTSFDGSDMFRIDRTNGRLTYKGKKTRAFNVTATLTVLPFITRNFGSPGNPTYYTSRYVFYIKKISTANTNIMSTKSITDSNAGYFQTVIVNGVVTLSPNDSVELWAYTNRRSDNNFLGSYNSFDIYSFNLILK